MRTLWILRSPPAANARLGIASDAPVLDSGQLLTSIDLERLYAVQTVVGA